MLGILNVNCGDLMGRIVKVGPFQDGKYLISAPTEDGKDGFVGHCEPNAVLILLESKKEKDEEKS